jgi:hypothetical protein
MGKGVLARVDTRCLSSVFISSAPSGPKHLKLLRLTSPSSNDITNRGIGLSARNSGSRGSFSIGNGKVLSLIANDSWSLYIPERGNRGSAEKSEFDPAAPLC